MKKNNKTSTILITLGALFLLNAIVGRYLVLPGYLAGLETGGNTLAGASELASPWKIVRYLLWAYSFKLGIYFIFLGAIARTTMSTARKRVVAVGGFIYIAFAYIPFGGTQLAHVRYRRRGDDPADDLHLPALGR